MSVEPNSFEDLGSCGTLGRGHRAINPELAKLHGNHCHGPSCSSWPIRSPYPASSCLHTRQSGHQETSNQWLNPTPPCRNFLCPEAIKIGCKLRKGVGSPWPIRTATCCLCSAPHHFSPLFSMHSLSSKILCAWKLFPNFCLPATTGRTHPCWLLGFIFDFWHSLACSSIITPIFGSVVTWCLLCLSVKPGPIFWHYEWESLSSVLQQYSP